MRITQCTSVYFSAIGSLQPLTLHALTENLYLYENSPNKSSQEEGEKSPDSCERSSRDLIPSSPKSKSLANKRRKLGKSVPKWRKQHVHRKQPIQTMQRKYVDHDQQKG